MIFTLISYKAGDEGYVDRRGDFIEGTVSEHNISFFHRLEDAGVAIANLKNRSDYEDWEYNLLYDGMSIDWADDFLDDDTIAEIELLEVDLEKNIAVKLHELIEIKKQKEEQILLANQLAEQKQAEKLTKQQEEAERKLLAILQAKYN